MVIHDINYEIVSLDIKSHDKKYKYIINNINRKKRTRSYCILYNKKILKLLIEDNINLFFIGSILDVKNLNNIDY